jgi:hypothetical protein
VAEGVRRDSDLGQRRPGGGRGRDALMDNVAEPEPREGTAGRIHKERDMVRELDASIPERRAQEVDRLGPQRAEPLLPDHVRRPPRTGFAMTRQPSAILWPPRRQSDAIERRIASIADRAADVRSPWPNSVVLMGVLLLTDPRARVKVSRVFRRICG